MFLNHRTKAKKTKKAKAKATKTKKGPNAKIVILYVQESLQITAVKNVKDEITTMVKCVNRQLNYLMKKV
jgi:hypothetical protein